PANPARPHPSPAMAHRGDSWITFSDLEPAGSLPRSQPISPTWRRAEFEPDQWYFGWSDGYYRDLPDSGITHTSARSSSPRRRAENFLNTLTRWLDLATTHRLRKAEPF